MELKKISESVRYRAELKECIIEATVTKENGTQHIEGGNLSDAEGRWLGSFSLNSGSESYNFSPLYGEQRTAHIAAIEEFVEAVRKEVAE